MNETKKIVKETTQQKKVPQEREPVHESVYEIGHTTYIVRTYFNPDGTESLEELVRRLIMQDIAELSV